MSVALPKTALNVRDLDIVRPARDQEVGGDGTERLMHRRLRARFTERSEFSRDAQGRSRIIIGVMLIPKTDPKTGKLVDIQGGDKVRFSDYRGVRQEREVALAKPVTPLGRIDHLRVELI